ncbi:polygalacturonase ADPG1-like isoform X2 [Salvia splendens]|uniref:polygalacturonase ADPG1-like isoform X2 n=1 Tax=Salvia splendens TaxID=180675 RepID=UPI001C2620A8|nr:polygalacturonase ADPG1-like isoform X2 [Salvia splendens]
MNTLNLLCFLLLLVLPLRLASKQYSDGFEDGVFKVQETNDEDSNGSKKATSNVDAFGAKGDGVSDDTKAFVNAWKKACSKQGSSIFLVPKGKRYLVSATKFKGPCAGMLTIQALTIDSSSSVNVKDLTIRNAQQMHFIIGRSDSVRVSGVTISAPGDSPNTDGIHVTGSTNVVLQDCKIGTGDDCISIVSESSNIKMKNIYCGPGHGISIGSLGKDNSTGMVEKVVLDNAFIRDTTNGLRIKTWQGGSGYVRSMRYQNVRMENVSNPIIIDQFYCDSPSKCEDQASAVEVSEIFYKNITGTSATRITMKFACSDAMPCSNIILSNINMQSEDDDEETYCNNASSFICGRVHPSADCLLSSALQEREGVVEDSFSQHIIHTEL